MLIIIIQMNFILKTLFKQVLPDYFDIRQNNLEIESGDLRLFDGQLKKQKLNALLKKNHLKIVDSKYHNLTIEIPWFEFTTKPVRISSQKLFIEIQKEDPNENTQINQIKPIQNKSQNNPSASNVYLKSFVTRLLLNLQLSIKSLCIIVRHRNSEVVFQMKDFSVKNSNLYAEQTRNIRKSVTIEMIRMYLNKKQVVHFGSANLCISYEQQKLKIISVFSCINIYTQYELLRYLLELKLNKEQYYKQENKIAIQQQQLFQPKEKSMNIYIKIEQINLRYQFKAKDNFIVLKVKNIEFNIDSRALLYQHIKLKLQKIQFCHKECSILTISNNSLTNHINYMEFEQQLIKTIQIIHNIEYGQQCNIVNTKIFNVEILIQLKQFVQFFQSDEIYEILEIADKISSSNNPTKNLKKLQSQKQIPKQQKKKNIKTKIVFYKNCLKINTIENRSLTLLLSFVNQIQNTSKSHLRILHCLIQNENQIQGLKIFGFNSYGKQQINISSSAIYHLNLIEINLDMIMIEDLQLITRGFNILTQAIGTKQQNQIKSVPDFDNLKSQKSTQLIILIDCIKFSLGSCCKTSGSEKIRFIKMLEICLNDVNYLSKSPPDSLQVRLNLQIYFLDQQTLLEEKLTNEIQIKYLKSSNQLILQFRSKIQLKLDIKYIKSLQRLLNKESSMIKIQNFTKNKIKIKKAYVVIELESKKMIDIFVTDGQPIQIEFQKLISKPFQLIFQNQNEKVIDFQGSSMKLIAKVLKTKHSITHIIIKSYANIINLASDFGIIDSSKNLQINIPKINYDKLDFDNQYQLLQKSQDFQEFISYFSTFQLQELNFHSNNKSHKLELILEKPNSSLYAIKQIVSLKYSHYLIHQILDASHHMKIMPFLIIKNHTNLDFKITIFEKKSNREYITYLFKNSIINTELEGDFDFYMKQFIIQFQTKGENIYTSQQYYFNTFAFINEPVQRIIPLRNTTKTKYDRKYVSIRESVIIKSKVLEISYGLLIRNKSSFNLSCYFKQRNQQSETALIEKDSQKYYSVGLKDQDYLVIYFQNLIQIKIKIQVRQLHQQKHIISFNFCKISDKFQNVFFLIESHKNNGIQEFWISDFIKLTNLTNQCIFIDNKEIKVNQTVNLTLPLNLQNQFNNKAIRLSETVSQQIYKKLFCSENNISSKPHLTQSYDIRFTKNLEEKIDLFTFIKMTYCESVIQRKQIFRILKEVNIRINFYICQIISPQQQNHQYTLIVNHTKQYFLISQETKFETIFQDDYEDHQPEKNEEIHKIVIVPNSESTIIRKGQLNIFLCNCKGEKLVELKNILQKKNIKIERNEFYNITTIEFEYKIQSFNQLIRTKNIDITFSISNCELMQIELQSLTIRALQPNKIDVLLNGLFVRQSQKNTILLGIPVQTYLILEYKKFPNNTILIKNMFLKLKTLKISIQKDFLTRLIKAYKSIQNEVKSNNQSPEEDQENILIIKVLKEKLFLIKNIFIDEFEINLNIELENFKFQNKMEVNSFNLKNKIYRQNKLLNEIEKFYNTTLIAKFPKLSFIVQNLKNPYYIVKSFFNLRDSMKQKHIESFKFQKNKYQFKSLSYYIETQLIVIENRERIFAVLKLEGNFSIILTNYRILFETKVGIKCFEATQLKCIKFQDMNKKMIGKFEFDKQIIEVIMQRRYRSILLQTMQQILD